MTTSPLPTLFLSHGSPMIALHPGEAGHFLQRLGPAIDAIWGRPQAIVAMSPHTATRTPFVLGAARHDTIHDFGGFPAPLYQVRYDAPGAPALSLSVHKLLQQAGFESQWTDQGGLDHGIWTALMHVYPEANIPVIPVSLTPQAKPEALMAMGQALNGLREQGVLIVGSGSLTHNLSRFFRRPTAEDAPEEPDCAAFRSWVKDHCDAADWGALKDYRRQAPHAVEMHPTDEHWLPFYFAAGAAMSADESVPALATRLHGSVTHGHLAMDAYAFGAEASKLANV